MITKSQVIEVLPYFKRILAEHPDMTLDEMFGYVECELRKEKKQEEDRKKNCDEWFEALLGKKCLLDFNGRSYRIFEIDQLPPHSCYNESTTFEAYYIYRDEYEVVINKSRTAIRSVWFGCPFYDEKSDVKMRILTDEEYNELCKKCDNIIKQTKELNL